MVLAVGLALTILAIVAIFLRALVASRINDRWRWDFIWIACCAVFGIPGAVAVTISTLHGLGNNQALLSYDDIVATIRWAYIAIFFGLVATTFAKLSMIALMLQVQGPTAKKRNYILYALGGACALVNLLQIVLSATQCSPPARLWDRRLPGTCPRGGLAENWSIFQGALGAFTDFVLALWPIGIVRNLQTTLRVKVMFCFLMGLGLLPTIASAMRLSKLPGISNGTDDITAAFGPFMLWIVVEFWAIVILTSVPVLRPLFLRIFYGIKSTGRGTTSGGRSGLAVPLSTTATATAMGRPKSGAVRKVTALEVEEDDEAGIVISKSYRVTDEDEEGLVR